MSGNVFTALDTLPHSVDRRRRKRPSLARAPQYRVAPTERPVDAWLAGLIPEESLSDNGPWYLPQRDPDWFSLVFAKPDLDSQQDLLTGPATSSPSANSADDEKPSDEN